MLYPSALLTNTSVAMRENEDVVLRLSGSTIALVPYTKEHVLRYHAWMGDEELRRLTCSERLDLSEEYVRIDCFARFS